MADVCSCCGRKKTLLDVSFDYIDIDDELYGICSKCWINISEYSAGKISIDEVIPDTANKKIVDYLKNIKPDEVVELEVKERERAVNKIEAQKNNPLFDDIHQIARDLRFIKNLIIFGLVCGVVLEIIGLLGLI